MRILVKSIADLFECTKKSCTAIPLEAQSIPAVAIIINAKFRFN